MKRWLLAAIAALPVIVWADGQSKDPITQGDPTAGASRATTCFACHGPGGNGANNPAWPKLAGQGSGYIYAQLKLLKAGTRQASVMNAQAAALSDQDMRDLAAFFGSQAPVPGVGSKDAIAVAQPLYRGGDAAAGIPACSACHGPEGQGNPAAAMPRLGGQNAPYTVEQLQAYRAGQRKAGDKAPIMASIAAHLSDTQIEALASYLSGLR
jgi:cytochrome c553